MYDKDREDFRFPRWTNSIRPLATVALLGGMVYFVVLVAYFFAPETTNVGYAPEQPIEYSHALHAGELGIDCRYCHTGVETGPVAGIPPTETCMNCHRRLNVESEKTALLHESAETGAAIAWQRVHDLPDFVFFRHSSHLKAGVGCVSCHGRVDEMEVVEQVETLSMSWCLDCHRDPDPHLRPREHLTELAWTTDDPRSLGRELRDHANINPSESCSTCHR